MQNYPFGRDLFYQRAKDELELFNSSLKEFASGDTLAGFELFLNSLLNYTIDTSNDNITIKKSRSKLHFEILEGLAKVEAVATKTTLHARCVIISGDDLNINIKRYLLTRNYQLTYCKYELRDTEVELTLDLKSRSFTTHKIFFALREIALNAAYDKEYIASEFGIKPTAKHILIPDESVLMPRYDFMHSKIKKLKDDLANIGSSENLGINSFLLLEFILSIDYLLSPKLNLKHLITKRVNEYFSEGFLESKNEEIYEFILTMERFSFEEFSTNFYCSKQTFSPTETTPNEEIISFIDETFAKIAWYKNNRFFNILDIIYCYMASYLLYNYGLHSQTKALLHIFLKVHYYDFFASLGESKLFEKNAPNAKLIASEISAINTLKGKKRLEEFSKKLDYSSLGGFNRSFFLALKNFDPQEF